MKEKVSFTFPSLTRITSFILLILLAGVLTLVSQTWVGNVTRYQPDFAEKQQILHDAILYNRLPPGQTSWTEMGANGTNTRVATVYFAEALHRITNLSILKVYWMIDTVALFVTFLLLFAYLRQTSSPIYSLVGLLYVAAILPLTYLFAYFHPWDRVSLVCWIALLILLRSERLVSFTFLLAVSITVKYDTLLLPGLYFLANVTWDNWPRIALRSALMFAVSFGTWIGMRLFLPGGFEERHILAQLFRNLGDFRSTLFSYPPLLGFLIPMILAFAALRWADRFSRASVWFGVLLFVPLIIATNFMEIRAEMPILILLLPSALMALRSL
ncbi:MAG: hypothetical protein ACREQP_03985, partial [Candidatus Binatia bacterium]